MAVEFAPGSRTEMSQTRQTCERPAKYTARSNGWPNSKRGGMQVYSMTACRAPGISAAGDSSGPLQRTDSSCATKLDNYSAEAHSTSEPRARSSHRRHVALKPQQVAER